MKDNIKYPRNETAWTVYQNTDGTPAYLITSRPMRDIYYLYEVHEDGSLTKLGKANSPAVLEQKYVWLDKKNTK